MDLIKLNNNLKQVDTVEIMVSVLESLEDFIADLNRSQLVAGKRDDGSYIEPEYSPVTELLKRPKSGTAGITSHVTLFDTGKLHNSIFASIFPDEIILDSKDSKVPKLEDKYQNFLGLTKENITKLKDKALPLFYKRLNEQIYK
ncbi:tail protein [Rhodobacteraceae phage LS06-2018-MD05]|nr:tail protein [Rhodobacteraceae phage LS06-2018-MD05]